MKRFHVGLVHGLLFFLVLALFLPLYFAIVAASHDGSYLTQSRSPMIPGSYFLANLKLVLTKGFVAVSGQPVWQMISNSFLMAIGIACGKLILALLAAFALVYFDFPGKTLCFAFIFSTLLLPIEVRIIPTFALVASFSWLNTLQGLTIPLMASATATFLFHQYFKTLPRELMDAAILDGAGPFQFFFHVVVPLAKPQIAALFIIFFVYGWNQYLWPLVITTDAQHETIVMGIRFLVGVADQIPQWHLVMAIALIALIPPCAVVITMQHWFEKGLKH